ncbi:hypothetical protein B0O80DRAFT_429814 [Mortierella sp. GBAus27b]|nr:hypothetical protein B0O80DRAFT_429814 [Mortierella sp. GBAus27b]
MLFNSVISSPRGDLSPKQLLELANIYLEHASRIHDSGVALVLCHDTEVTLSQAKKAARHTEDQILRLEIASTYIELGRLLESQGHRDTAHVFFKKSEKWGGNPHTYVRPSKLSASEYTAPTAKDIPGAHVDTPAIPPTLPSVTPTKRIQDIAIIAHHIFPANVVPPTTIYKLPEADEHLTSTPQLVTCLSLMQVSHAPGEIMDTTTRTWLQAIEKDTDEQERLTVMATDVVRAFKRDELKDAKAVAEVVSLTPVLDKDTFRDLLSEFYTGVNQSGLLDHRSLEGLAQLVQGADPGYLDADDLVKILQLLSTRLKETHGQSLNHKYLLTLTVSHVLDAMADTSVKNLDREKLHAPLLAYLDGLKGSSDPYLVYQAAYAYQALLCVPDNETAWQAAMRRTGKVVKGVSGLVSAVKGFDLVKFFDGLGDIQKGIAEMSEVVQLAKSAYEGVNSLVESGEGLMKALKEGLSFQHKRAWYSALRGADTLIRDGELATFRRLVCEGPCRRDPAFQWGVCQRLGAIATNTQWDADTRRGAVAFLGEIYRNDGAWGQHASVKVWALNILMQLATSSGGGMQSMDIPLESV